MHENEISYNIRKAAFNVYNTLGPGLLENVYEAAMAYELDKLGHQVQTQVTLPVIYKDVKLELGYRLDLLVDQKVIIEIKSVEELAKVHYKQLLTYLKLTDCKLGLLINFNTNNIKENIIRIANNL